MSFDSLGLRAELLRALADEGYVTPTPVQAQAIPLVLAGRDVLAGAQTGTGKTAGFTLPLLQRLSAPGGRRPERRGVRTLILTPTRELAIQVQESVRTYGRHLNLTSTAVYGGVKINPQIRALDRGVDFLIATPGRLLDHLQQGTVTLRGVEALVLDEADRMLDMGFIRDIRRILAYLPTRRQTLLFSATFTDDILALASDFLSDPARVEVARRSQESELVHQAAYPATKENKRDLVVRLLGDLNIDQALIFTRTKHGADRLAKLLERDGVEVAVIHGNRSQPQRLRALADFKAGVARVLLATDIAARGIDIEQLPFVINYELPNVAEDYVHRIGRTGRAGSPGTALSLVSEDELPHLAGIEKLLQKRIERRSVEGFPATSNAWHNPPALGTVPRPPQAAGARSQGARRPRVGGGQPVGGGRRRGNR